MKLVIVESPAKAQTINKYLGNDYKVIASVGHVRDLPSKDGAVLPEDNFKMSWEMHKDKEKVVKEIISELKIADTLILATDPDREGEAISWHLKEILNSKKTIQDKPVQRVVFNEITNNAVLEAMKIPREINTELVEAYLARRALDHLIGFSISPILWRKLPGSKSAGRVQSVSVRLIVEKEREIKTFITKSSYKSIAVFETDSGVKFKAELNEKYSSVDEVKEFFEKNYGSLFNVAITDQKPGKKSPTPPFTTSTLQQEASRKLGFGVTRTMSTAQKLYEAGLITYMRTDSVTLSNDAKSSIVEKIETKYGNKYVNLRDYKNKNKSAQEAHEAVRPTDINVEEITSDYDQQRLYELIWKRTISSQMSDAQIERTVVNIKSNSYNQIFIARGEVIKFDGFLRVYNEGTDDEVEAVSYTHLRAHETVLDLVCRLLLEKKKKKKEKKKKKKKNRQRQERTARTPTQ